MLPEEKYSGILSPITKGLLLLLWFCLFVCLFRKITLISDQQPLHKGWYTTSNFIFLNVSLKFGGSYIYASGKIKSGFIKNLVAVPIYPLVVLEFSSLPVRRLTLSQLIRLESYSKMSIHTVDSLLCIQ